MTQPLPKTYAELRWLDDMDPQGAETASDLESLEQDVLHVLKERLASNLDDPNRGLGVEDYLGSTEDKLATLAHEIDTQLAEDSRLTSVQTTVTKDSTGTINIHVTCDVAGQVVEFNFTVGPNGLSKA